MNVPNLLFFFGFAAIVVAIAVYAHKVAEKRKLAIAAWAGTRGLSFTRDRDWSFDQRYDFACLNRGDDRYAYNVSRGRVGEFGICAFDYHYETHSTDSKGNRTDHDHHFSAVVVETGLRLKPLSIRKENFFDKVGEFVGLDDIDFELAEFSREFYVKSPDRRWAFDVLHQESMEFLLNAPRFQIEFLGRSVVAWRDSSFSAEEFEQALQVSMGLTSRLPKSVVQELRGLA
jgi:hypothetical protein